MASTPLCGLIVKTFKTKAEVIYFLNNMEDLEKIGKRYSVSCVYVLSHNEYAIPDFTPRRYANGREWGIHRNVYYYYNGVLNAPSSGRVAITHDELRGVQVQLWKTYILNR